MKTGSIHFTLSAQIASNVAAHGEQHAAILLKKRVDFRTYYMLRFGHAPRLELA